MIQAYSIQTMAIESSKTSQETVIASEKGCSVKIAPLARMVALVACIHPSVHLLHLATVHVIKDARASCWSAAANANGSIQRLARLEPSVYRRHGYHRLSDVEKDMHKGSSRGCFMSLNLDKVAICDSFMRARDTSVGSL